MDLPAEYLVDFSKVEKTGGQYDQQTGIYQEGQENPVAAKGIILPLSNDDLKYAEAGTYTVHDRKIYISEPLTIGQEIEYKGVRYTVRAEKDYSEQADVYIYLAQRVGEAND